MERIIYKITNGKLVKGTIFNLLLNHGDFTLVDLKVYADGELDCLGPITFEQLAIHMRNGKLSRNLPAKGKLFIPHVGHIVAEHSSTHTYDEEKFLAIIKETIKSLNQEDDLIASCISTFREWLINPSAKKFDTLKSLFLKLPNDKKALFEIDYKDPLIKLMNSGSMTRDEREFYLKDYFEGEWIELK